MMSLIPSSREMLQDSAWLLAHGHFKTQHAHRMEERLSPGPSANFDFRFERMIHTCFHLGRAAFPTRYPHTR